MPLAAEQSKQLALRRQQVTNIMLLSLIPYHCYSYRVLVFLEGVYTALLQARNYTYRDKIRARPITRTIPRFLRGLPIRYDDCQSAQRYQVKP
jgi:hypothetical protein